MKYRSYYVAFSNPESKRKIAEFEANDDQIAIMMSKNVEPYPDLVVRVENDYDTDLQWIEREVVIFSVLSNY